MTTRGLEFSSKVLLVVRSCFDASGGILSTKKGVIEKTRQKKLLIGRHRAMYMMVAMAFERFHRDGHAIEVRHAH